MLTTHRPTPSPLSGTSAVRDASLEQLIALHRETGDERFRARAIEAAMPLARKLARRYEGTGETLEDLIQVASMGLVKAVDRFDPAVGRRFASFAIPTITGELRRHFRDTSWSVHLPRGLQEDVLRVRTVARELSERLGRAPTVSELSEASGLETEQVVEALQATVARDTSSLDQPLGGEENDVPLGEMLGRTDGRLALVEARVTVSPHLRALPEREREVLFLRFVHDMTQTEIGERVGCSQMQVSRLLRRALERLQQASGADAAA